MSPETHRAFVLLGSNIDAERNMVAAVRLLRERCQVLAVSAAYETVPVGVTGQDAYLNAAALIETQLDPARLKKNVLHPIERQLGRVRTSNRFAPRTIDLDLVLYDSQVLNLHDGKIPDPAIVRHGYAAIPLAEIAPDYVHPVAHRTLAEIADEVPDTADVQERPDVSLSAGE
jgi:2-amino-4-hydroxy-6-hydroxymethyldihydropteridine diphosphokinase